MKLSFMKQSNLRSSVRLDKKGIELVATILHYCLFVFGGILLAHWTWIFFTPTIPSIPIKTDQSASSQTIAILSGHWFSPKSGASMAIQPSAINFKLVGVYAPSGSKSGFAIFKLADGKQRAVKLHEEIIPGIPLQAIKPDEVKIGQEGNLQSLMLENKTSPSASVSKRMF